MTPHLTVSLAGSGYHPAAWRVSPLPPTPNAAAFQAMARTAERAKLDAILLGPRVDDDAVGMPRLDPLPLLGSLIGVTRHIGLAAAWTVDHTEPYHVARVFATLDHLSYGRTAWIARLGEPDRLMSRIGKPSGVDDPEAYHRRAGELIDVVRKLWDSWEDEAYAVDKPSGMFVDPLRVHPIHHEGASFTVRGPLNVPRPPQGHPVLVLSDPPTSVGRRFAAVAADVILMDCKSSSDSGECYRELRSLAKEREHAPRLLANLHVVLGETEIIARRRAADLDALVSIQPRCARFIGTPEQLIAWFASWREQRACDGFNLLPAVLPDDLDLLADEVITLARRHGLFRADYAGETLRDHLGLTRPPSQYVRS